MKALPPLDQTVLEAFEDLHRLILRAPIPPVAKLHAIERQIRQAITVYQEMERDEVKLQRRKGKRRSSHP